jgi:hypothetical protein
MLFPSNEDTEKIGDQVSVRITAGGDEYLLFTGEIYSSGVHGKYHELCLTDSYKKLCDTYVVTAYRKEQAKAILQDTLDSSGITEASVTCPPVEIARFSTKKIPALHVLKQLIRALEEHGCLGLRFFFDEEDKFHFGTAGDTGKNEGSVFEFESGKSIIKKGEGFIEVMPLPIRHTQEVIVDGAPLITRRTSLTVSGNQSRLILWLREEE